MNQSMLRYRDLCSKSLSVRRKDRGRRGHGVEREGGHRCRSPEVGGRRASGDLAGKHRAGAEALLWPRPCSVELPNLGRQLLPQEGLNHTRASWAVHQVLSCAQAANKKRGVSPRAAGDCLRVFHALRSVCALGPG